MSYILFLNELSFGAAADRWAANVAMAEFDELLRKLYEWNPETSLVGRIELSSNELAPGYSLQSWINAERANIERWRFMLLRQTKAPSGDFALPHDVEYKYGGQTAHGLGRADHHYGLCVSLRLSDAWDSSELTVERTALVGDADDAKISSEERTILHSSTCETASAHKDRWLEHRDRLPVKFEGRRFRHPRFGIMVECRERNYFYSVDHAGHGESAVKRFTEGANALHWDADLDPEGNVIENKHKSSVGIRVPKNELHAV